jgi:uncharacterized coiled-coil DUF342 family protein
MPVDVVSQVQTAIDELLSRREMLAARAQALEDERAQLRTRLQKKGLLHLVDEVGDTKETKGEGAYA